MRSSRDEYGIGGAITVTCEDHSFNTASLMEQDYGAGGGYTSEGYLIHTEAGKTYLYLQHQSDNDSHYINIFDLTTKTPVYTGFTGSSWSDSPTLTLTVFFCGTVWMCWEPTAHTGSII